MSVEPSSAVSSCSLSPSVESSPSLVKSPKQLALEECVARINLLIQRLNFQLCSDDFKDLQCPILLEFPENPVVTGCGHLYDRAMIEQWKNNGGSCSVCHKEVTQLTPVYALQDFNQRHPPKDPVPTFANFLAPNPESARVCLEAAKKLEDLGQDDSALKLYGEAFKYTKAAGDYAPIPLIYDRLGESKKATLSRLHLGLCQVQEGKIKEACETLTVVAQESPLVVALSLQTDRSPENITRAMTSAAGQESLEDRIFIYKQIIANDPTCLDAYQQLIPLITDRNEKTELLLTAADLVQKAGLTDLETSFRKETESKAVSNVISPTEWANAKTLELPPYPQDLVDFLAGDCTIWPGKKRSETHIVVPLFPQVNIDGRPVALTLVTLDQLDKASGGPGYRFIWHRILKGIPAEQEFHYGVLTNNVIPDSRYKSYEDQRRLLPEGYEVPGVLDAARALLWENRRSGNRYLSNDPNTYTHCKEVVQGYHLVVGGFVPSGLYVRYVFDGEVLGTAGWRNF